MPIPKQNKPGASAPAASAAPAKKAAPKKKWVAFIASLFFPQKLKYKQYL
jgi:hypothetical protein